MICLSVKTREEKIELLENNVKDIVGGGSHSFILTLDGNVYAFGNNSKGQLGTGRNKNHFIPVKVETLSNIIQISAGSSHSLALSSDGNVYVFGYNENGQLGTGDRKMRSVPIKLETLSNIKEIICGVDHSIVLTTDGEIFGFGLNDHNQLGMTYGSEDQSTPSLINIYEPAQHLWK